MNERVMFAPILEPAFLSGVGPRVDPSTLALVTGHAFSYPYEEIRLKPRR
jgi:peptide/nickel transport system substrate-binding protein